MQKLKPLFWALCCTGLATPAWAGLSPLRVLSQAGQPFEAELNIVDEALPESAYAELADRNRYSELAPYSPSAGSLRMTLLKKPDGGQYVVKVQGPAHFEESELRFAVQVSWADGRLVREYRVNPRQGVPPAPPARDEQPAKKAVPSAKPGLAMPAMLLGEIKLQSQTGQPLRAEVEVRGQDLDQGELNARVQGLGRAARTQAIEVAVLSRDARHAVLSLSSQQNIEVPALRLRLLVSHGQDQAAKTYTLLLDPQQRAAARAAKYRSVVTAQDRLIEARSYRVRPGDTLARIAGQLDSGKRPIDAVMQRLVRDNPAAFVHANPNRLQAGARLAYPAAWGRVKAAAPAAKPARLAVPKPEHKAPEPKPAHKTEAPVVPKPPVPAPAGNVRRIELEHKLQQQDKQLQRLESKARELQQQLKAEAQQKALQERQAREAKQALAAQQARAAKQALEAQKAQEAQKAREAQAHKAQPAPKPMPEPERPKLLKELPAEPHPRDYGPELRAGAAAAGLLLTGVGGMAWLYHRRRQHQAEQGLLPQPELMESPPPPRDWLELAEIYQSSGQYHQAVDTLRAGIAAVPNRQDLHFMLLQLLGKRQDFAGFLEEAQESLDRFGRESWLGQRVLEWGRIVMPSHPLFSGRAAQPEPEEMPLTPEMGRATPGEKPPAAAPGSLWAQHQHGEEQAPPRA